METYSKEKRELTEKVMKGALLFQNDPFSDTQPTVIVRDDNFYDLKDVVVFGVSFASLNFDVDKFTREIKKLDKNNYFNLKN
jgi:hypothetical protein